MLPPTPPEDLAHRRSSRHRADVTASALCGCFACLATFRPAEIVEWVDAPDDAPEALANAFGRTALCPRCGVDAVLGSASGFPITPRFLGRMRARWF